MDYNLLIGLVGLILTLIGLYYAKQSYKKDHIDKPNEEKLHLLAQFKSTQALSNMVYNGLYAYVASNNYFDNDMWPGITYSTYLDQMKKSQGENLSDELYDKLLKEDFPSATMQSMCKSLETQFESLMLIHNEIKLKSQQKTL